MSLAANRKFCDGHSEAIELRCCRSNRLMRQRQKDQRQHHQSFHHLSTDIMHKAHAFWTLMLFRRTSTYSTTGPMRQFAATVGEKRLPSSPTAMIYRNLEPVRPYRA
jgi:hypothetical protein